MMVPRSIPFLLSFGLLCTASRSARAEERTAAENERPPESASETESPSESAGEAALMCTAVDPSLLTRLEPIRVALHEAFRSAGTPILRDEELIQRRDAALPPGNVSERASELRERARAHFLAFEFEEARAALEQARLRLLERFGDLVWDPDLARVELDLARVLLDLGQAGLAEGALRRAARISPRIRPEPGNYPPRLLQAWEAVMAATEPIEEQMAPLEPERLLRAARALGLDWVLSMRLRRASPPSDSSVELTLFSLEGGGQVSQATIELPPSEEDWGALLGGALAAIFAALSPPAETSMEDVEEEHPTRLLVMSTPPGASVDLNGEPIDGTTPWLLEAEPGPQRIGISLAGYRPEEIVVTAWPGQTRPIEVRLERGSDRQWYRTWWFWTVVSVVVVGGVAGFATWGALASQNQPDVNVVVNVGE